MAEPAKGSDMEEPTTDEERRAKKAAYDKAYYAANRERRRADNRAYHKANRERLNSDSKIGRWPRQLRRQHGLTPEGWASIWQSQDGCCYLCSDPLTGGRNVHIDHDHSCCPPNYSCQRCRRGLACNFCNAIIGMARDDPERLHRIAHNLEMTLTRMTAQKSDDEELVLF